MGRFLCAITANFRQEEYARLKALASARRITLSELMREIVWQYLRDNERHL